MLLDRNDRLPEGPNQSYELLDGTGLWQTGARVKLRSRNGNDFNDRYSAIAKAPSTMADETVIDDEVVAEHELLIRRPRCSFHIRRPDATAVVSDTSSPVFVVAGFRLIVENFGACLLTRLLDRLHTDRAPSSETRRRPQGQRRAILTGRPEPEEGRQECLGYILKRVFANCTLASGSDR